MSIKELVRPTRIGRIFWAVFFGVVVLVLFSFGTLMLVRSFAEGHAIAFAMGLALWAGAALIFSHWRRSSGEWPSIVAERIGVPDSVQHQENAGPMTANVPYALRGQKPPNGAVVVAGRSIWSSRVTIMVVLAIGVGLFYLGWNVKTLFPEWHVSGSYLLMGFGGLLLTVGLFGLRPRSWHGCFLGFIAMPEGIYVHGQGVYPEGHEWTTPQTRWLFVPWGNVVDVRKGLVWKSTGQGAAIWFPSTKLTLRLTPDEAREWFPYADDEPSDDGMNRIVSLDYSDSDPSPKETVPRLQQLWAPE